MADVNIDDIDPRSLTSEQFAALLEAAEQYEGDLAAMPPRTFARLIKLASTDQIRAVIGDPARRRKVLDAIFSRMAGQFRADKAPRRDSAIHWRIAGDGEPDVYETWIAGGECSTSAEPRYEPRVTLSMSAEQFLKLVSGNGSPTMMFMTGKLKLDGDIGFAAGLSTIFDIPKA